MSSAIVLTAGASTSPAAFLNWICAKVILPSLDTGRAGGGRVGDGQHLGRLGDLRADRLDLLPCCLEDAAVLDREHDRGRVAQLLLELVLQQVVRPLGYSVPGKLNVLT